jgi:hypothetical protein
MPRGDWGIVYVQRDGARPATSPGGLFLAGAVLSQFALADGQSVTIVPKVRHVLRSRVARPDKSLMSQTGKDDFS